MITMKEVTVFRGADAANLLGSVSIIEREINLADIVNVENFIATYISAFEDVKIKQKWYLFSNEKTMRLPVFAEIVLVKLTFKNGLSSLTPHRKFECREFRNA
jgi:hypothetical protein